MIPLDRVSTLVSRIPSRKMFWDRHLELAALEVRSRWTIVLSSSPTNYTLKCFGHLSTSLGPRQFWDANLIPDRNITVSQYTSSLLISYVNLWNPSRNYQDNSGSIFWRSTDVTALKERAGKQVFSTEERWSVWQSSMSWPMCAWSVIKMRSYLI
jgi:hypothetical protein